MDESTLIFEQQRPRLRAVAHRILGSSHEADDAVQEAWLRLERTDVSGVENLPAWLTTVVSRVGLDQLRSRAVRREDVDAQPQELAVGSLDPAVAAEHADAVGRALLVVLDTLVPAERVAFVLHDLFGTTFDEIAPVLGRSSAACRQLASRARRRVRGQGDAVEQDRVRQRHVVDAFMDASRNGEFERLLALLHPDAVLGSDGAAAAMGSPARLTGAEAVATMFDGKARAARPAELDGFAAAAWAMAGTLRVVFAFTVEDGLVREIELIAGDLDRLDVRLVRRTHSARTTGDAGDPED